MPRTEEQSQPREEKVEQQKEQEEQAPVTAAVASVALETLESLPAPLKKLATAPPSETESEDDDSEYQAQRALATRDVRIQAGRARRLDQIQLRQGGGRAALRRIYILERRLVSHRSHANSPKAN
ncbi:hypothetical protein PI125_g23957 [Phytophthora idaei]|nr:hypothetical protein PI125_g23957 [Phytophthora idaei]